MNSENGLTNEARDDDEKCDENKPEDSAEESKVNQGHVEGEVDDGERNCEKDTSESTEAKETDMKSEDDNENASSEVESKNVEKSSEQSNDIQEAANEEITTQDIDKGETTAGVVNEENSVEKTEEGSSVDKEINDAVQDSERGSSGDKEDGLGTHEAKGGTENLETPKPEQSVSGEDGNVTAGDEKNIDEEITKESDGIEGVAIDNKVVNEDKDGHSENQDGGSQEDEKRTETEVEAEETEAIKTGEGETNEKENDKNKGKENDVVGEGGGEIQKESEDIQEVKTVESKQEETKESGVVESEWTEVDGNKEVEKEEVDAPDEKPTDEKQEDNSENQKDKNNDDATVALVEKSHENVENEDKTAGTIMEEVQETSSGRDENESKENKSEEAVGPMANAEALSHEGQSQISSAEDNKSEVLSENIDELVDEILAVTDDVDAGKKSEESLSKGKEEIAEDTSKNSEKLHEPPVSGDENTEKVQDDVQPVDTSENSEETSEAVISDKVLNSNDEHGVVSSQQDDSQSSAKNEQSSSAHLDAETKKEDFNEGQRAGSGSTAYRVQTG